MGSVIKNQDILVGRFLREDFGAVSRSNLPLHEKVKAYLDILDKIDPKNSDDRHTLVNMLIQCGVTDGKAEGTEFFSWISNRINPKKSDPGYKGPGLLPRSPAMSAEQAPEAVGFLRKKLPVVEFFLVEAIGEDMADKIGFKPS